MKNTIHIWTDGSAYPKNPGFGGWGAVLEYLNKHGVVKVLHVNGLLPDNTTQNQAETIAVIESLKLIKLPRAKVIVYTDSQYVVFGIEKVNNRLKNKRAKMPKANPAIWEELLEVIREGNLDVTVEKVKGHADISNNELADRLAYLAAAEKKHVEERFDRDP